MKPDVSASGVRMACEEAKRYGFAAVCVPPSYVKMASWLLRGSGVRVCTVVGFPLGYAASEVKVAEARKAIEDGAEELDVVLNVSALKSGDLEAVKRDVRAVTDVAKAHGVLVKVIIETCYLTDQEKVLACKLAKECGADFVKTSTGFGPQGATVDDVRLLRQVVGPDVGVKAAGGIRTLEDARAMIEAGATRIGTSHAVAIAEEEIKASRGSR